MITWLKVIDYFKKCPKWQSNRIRDSFVIVIVPALASFPYDEYSCLRGFSKLARDVPFKEQLRKLIHIQMFIMKIVKNFERKVE